MEKTYKCKNGIIYVTLPESCDREELKKATEEFLKKVISGGKNNGNTNTSRNLGEKQILY